MDEPENNTSPTDRPSPLYRKKDIDVVMKEIALRMQYCTRAWIGFGFGRVLILKDDCRGLSTYYHYEEGWLTFFDHRGGSKRIYIEEITEIEGF